MSLAPVGTLPVGISYIEPAATGPDAALPVVLGLLSLRPRMPGLVGHFLADPAGQNGLYSRDMTGRTLLRGV